MHLWQKSRFPAVCRALFMNSAVAGTRNRGTSPSRNLPADQLHVNAIHRVAPGHNTAARRAAPLDSEILPRMLWDLQHMYISAWHESCHHIAMSDDSRSPASMAKRVCCPPLTWCDNVAVGHNDAPDIIHHKAGGIRRCCLLRVEAAVLRHPVQAIPGSATSPTLLRYLEHVSHAQCFLKIHMDARNAQGCMA